LIVIDPRRPRITELPPQKPGVVFQPQTYLAFQRGINLLVKAIRPTLGPTPRCVAIERSARNQAAKILDNGAVIARRIIELPDRDASMGALLLRHALWRLHEKVGDGTATAAFLFQEVGPYGQVDN
jgi:chaperonin GroEL (HSP60 family)